MEITQAKAFSLYRAILPPEILQACSIVNKPAKAASVLSAKEFRQSLPPRKLQQNTKAYYDIGKNEIVLREDFSEEEIFHETLHVIHRGLSLACLDEIAAYMATELAKEKGIVE